MRSPSPVLRLVIAALLAVPGLAFAGQAVLARSADAERAALERSLAAARDAQQRSERLEEQARAARREADRSRREAQALAARVQQSEAAIAANQAQLALIQRDQRALARRLAARRAPMVKLAAALQSMARRPSLTVLAQPGKARDIVRVRALLATLEPQIDARTAALRADLDRSRDLRRQVQETSRKLQTERTRLANRREALARLEARRRIDSLRLRDSARLEEQRALGLAEEARDIETLVSSLAVSGRLRDRLAALDGPQLRPPRPERSSVVNTAPQRAPVGPLAYRLPVIGEIVTGFNAPLESGLRSRGLELSVRAGAQVVAPAEGRVAFAGPFRGFGSVVIIDHRGGWTTLITGLSATSVVVGDTLEAGTPLGQAIGGRTSVGVELRRGAEPVDVARLL